MGFSKPPFRRHRILRLGQMSKRFSDSELSSDKDGKLTFKDEISESNSSGDSSQEEEKRTKR